MYGDPADLQMLVDYDLDQQRAMQLLDLVSSRVNHVIGQPIETAEVTKVYDGTGTRTLMLDRWPVTAVSEVVVTDTAGDDTTLDPDQYRWSRSGWLTRVGGSWPAHERSVTVTFTAGFGVDAGELDLVTSIVLAAAARTAPNPQQLDSISTDGTALNFTRAAAVLSFTRDERADLAKLSARKRAV